ncbi:hypothetical protein AB6A40_001566 [Gnathostoma spinigerum]|uniref:LysM domain-containing protein n=1 Tax=Gnathostoma spinigerum TaxID=75299 RepID=A0ABD6EEC3_9BILA
MMAGHDDERTFLCGYQRTRGYGSTATPESSMRKYSSLINHTVVPSDTLQGLALRYNSSMADIKRINRLWSNESLYLKIIVKIPIYEDAPNLKVPEPPETQLVGRSSIVAHSGCSESVKDIFNRVDSNIRRTIKSVEQSEERMKSVDTR